MSYSKIDYFDLILFEKLVEIDIFDWELVRNTRHWMRLYTDLLLEFSKLCYNILVRVLM